MKSAMRLGRNQADGIMFLIEINKNPSLFNKLKSVQKLANRTRHYQDLIYTSNQDEKDHLKHMVQQTIWEQRILREMAIEKDFRPLHACFDDRAVINLTNIPIPSDLLLCLSFGNKFVFPSPANTDNICKIMMELNNVIPYYFPEGSQDEAFKQASIQIKQYKHKYNNDTEKWLMLMHFRLTTFLSLHKNILIAKSDKGRHTVIIEKDIYHSKISQLVSNTNDYLPIDNISPSYLENINNNFISSLVNLGTIKQQNKFKLMDSSTNIAKFYGLIKIHKSNFPARPIVSQCGAPGFKLAGFMNDILNRIFPEKGFHLTNTLDLVKQLKSIELSTDDILVSFDVVSMFTSIPIDLLLKIIKKREKDIQKLFNINWTLFSAIMNFVLKQCAIFSYKNSLYKQKDSLAMGSPLSPILAKILMTEVLSFIFKDMSYKPKLCALYVDDSLWIVDKHIPNIILSKLNEFHPNIKFTMELESEASISFLDLKVTRSDNHLLTCWNKKSYASDMLLNYFSNHSMTCIKETAIAYVKNVINISSPEFFHDNKIILQRILKNNCFPEDIIIRILHEYYTLMRPIQNKPKKPSKFIPIVFRNKFSGLLNNRLHPLIPGHSITSVPNPQYKNPFSKLKDKPNIKCQTNIIVTLECECKKYIDIKHTKFEQNITHITNELHQTYSIDLRGKCIGSKHSMTRFKFLKHPNHFSMKSRYEFLILKNHDRLCFPKASNLHYRFKKIIREL